MKGKFILRRKENSYQERNFLDKEKVDIKDETVLQLY